MSMRVKMIDPPYPEDLNKVFERIMPESVPVLSLFRMLAQDSRLFQRLMGGNLLDKGNLSIRHRELIIDRITARCGAEYEWGVHVAFFAEAAKLGEAEIYSLVHGDADDACWLDEGERLLIRMCDSLDVECDLDDDLWGALTLHFSDAVLLEAIMLCGTYRMISYLVKAARLPLEPFALQFPTRREPVCLA